MILSNKAEIFSLMVVIACLVYFVVPAYIIGENKLTEGIKLKEAQDEEFSLLFDSNRNLVYLQGPFEIGVVSAMKNVLAEHPDLEGVILESNGGNIYQARGLARIIKDHSLSTYTYNLCFSACMLAYIAGSKRYISSAAKLGFHAYRLESKLTEPFLNIKKEQEYDLEFFRKQIPNHVFVNKIFNRSSKELWIPGIDELVRAGVVHEVLAGGRSLGSGNKLSSAHQ